MEKTPLEHPWERVAAADLAEVLHLIAVGEFDNPCEYVRRLHESAALIATQFGGVLSSSDPIGWDNGQPIYPNTPTPGIYRILEG